MTLTDRIKNAQTHLELIIEGRDLAKAAGDNGWHVILAQLADDITETITELRAELAAVKPRTGGHFFDQHGTCIPQGISR